MATSGKNTALDQHRLEKQTNANSDTVDLRTVERLAVVNPRAKQQRSIAEITDWLAQTAKRQIKAALGSIILAARPDLKRKLGAFEMSRYRTHYREVSLIDRLAMQALIARHTLTGAQEDVARAHREYWASSAVTEHHATLEQRFESSFLGKHYPILEAMDRLIATGKYHTLCEIGCGAGFVSDYVAKRWPSLRKVIGLDLSAEQIEQNRKRFVNQRLQFEAADATAWITENAEPGMLFFTFDGVLEYFPETTLSNLLQTLAAKAPVAFALVEPIAHDYDLAIEMHSRMFGGEMSFSHNYFHLFAGTGFYVRWQQELPRDRYLMIVATADPPQGA